LVGPLCNPAAAPFQLIGVGRQGYLDVMAAALARLGTRNAFLACGHEGLDEVSLGCPTSVRHVSSEGIRPLTWTCEDFNLPPQKVERVRVASSDESARVVAGILEGEPGPCRDLVLANAAAALLVSRQVQSLMDGVHRATEAIDSGATRDLLNRLIKVSNSPP
jgi:anthranilate phosphoribosyltransferase